MYVGEIPSRIVLFMNEVKESLRRDVQGWLRAEGFDVRPEPSPNDVSFGRVGLVIADITEIGDEEGEVDRLFSDADSEHVGVLAFPEGAERPDGMPEKEKLLAEQKIADRGKLLKHVDQELAETPQTQLRITSVPSSRVTQLLIGTLGPCPTTGEE